MDADLNCVNLYSGSCLINPLLVLAADAGVMCTLKNLRRASTYVLLALFVCSCSTGIHRARPSDDLEQVELKLKSVLPNGWSATRNGNSFELTRSNKLWVYNPMQQDLALTLDQWVKEVGVELTYTITLRFQPLIPKQRYDQLKAERAPYERIVNEGGHTIYEWENGVNEFHKRQLPVYFTDHYSIYAEKSDVFPEQLYPESVAFECKQVIASLDKLFVRYEPFSGKNSDFQVRP
ncbi:MAG TPA: hypothetical protein VF088_16845 [Pyrinomonadaceae bacterium]